MALQITNSTPNRTRTIIIATVVAVIILALGAWAIIAAINSVSRHGGSTIVADGSSQSGSTQPTSGQSSTGNSTGSAGGSTNSGSASSDAKVSSPADQYAPTGKSTNSGSTQSTPAVPSVPSAPVEQVPSTGPEDIIPTALLVGVAVYLLALSRSYTREAASLRV